jgi:hypothetical protein
MSEDELQVKLFSKREQELKERNLKGSDDCVQHSESLCLWTLSNVRNSKELENTTLWKMDL